jgi:DNA primase
LGLLGTLRRDGEQLQGICPLHKAAGEQESFGVHIGKQTFNCFACKKHGKVLDFVMQFKGIGAK